MQPFGTSAKQGTCADGVQFYCHSSTYPAIVLLEVYFIDKTKVLLWQIYYRAIFDTSAKRSEAHVL